MRRWLSLSVVVLLGVACTAPPETGIVEGPSDSPPTLEEARNAAYYGLGVGSPITLTNGLWEGEPPQPGSPVRPAANLVRDFTAMGDIDSGGIDETVVLLSDRSGGTGEFSYIALVDRAGDAITNTATLPIGDRVQLRDLVVEPGSITADIVQAGPSDAACCPGDIVRRRWELSEGKLVETGDPQILGRLSPETVGETEWALTWWDWEEPAPAEPLVTLTYADGRFAGHSGCNSYSGGVSAGAQPGDVVISAPMGTRMACPPPQMEVESRYLQAFGAVTKIGFMAGDLVMTYTDADGTIRTMFFTRR